MASWLCYAVAIAYLGASIDEAFRGHWWLVLMLVNYSFASLALGKITG